MLAMATAAAERISGKSTEKPGALIAAGLGQLDQLPVLVHRSDGIGVIGARFDIVVFGLPAGSVG